MHQQTLLQAVELVWSPDAVVKKKKKNLYDGRRKEAKAFLKGLNNFVQRGIRHLEKRSKRIWNHLVKSIFLKTNVDILRKIVKNKQNMPVKMKDGRMKVDLFTASAFVQTLDKLKPDNKKKIEDIINNGTKAQF